MKILYFICGLIGCIGLALTGVISENSILQFFCNLTGFILFGTCIIGYIDLSTEKEKKEWEKEKKKWNLRQY
ncbi:MAG: hypothetical protein LWW94_09895 [Candidatus Desulfofervidaceae bacterium]|nr:hypothetical protein [Candidatus Desulfofervidaceae bacterium]